MTQTAEGPRREVVVGEGEERRKCREDRGVLHGEGEGGLQGIAVLGIPQRKEGVRGVHGEREEESERTVFGDEVN